MNTKQLFGALAFAALGLTASARAENYEGVLTIRSERPRAEIALEAREAARHPIAGEASFVDRHLESGGRLGRADVHSAAKAAARAGNPYGDNVGAGVLNPPRASATHEALEPQARKTIGAGRARASGG